MAPQEKEGIQIPLLSDEEITRAFRKFSGGRSAILPHTAEQLAWLLGLAPLQAECLRSTSEISDVSLTEFIKWARKVEARQQKLNAGQVAHIFRVYDPKDTGKVSVKVFRMILTNVGEAMAEEEADDILTKLGLGGDVVDYKEVVAKLIVGK